VKTLEDFPHFVIAEVQEVRETGEVRLLGSFDEERGVETGVASLLGLPNFWIDGTLREFNTATKNGLFVVSSPGSPLKVGTTVLFVEGYWHRCVKMILDPHRRWERMLFQPKDMALYRQRGGMVGTPASRLSASMGKPDEIVPGGWDHEHCEICQGKVTAYPGSQHFGFTDGSGLWFCEGCYKTFVQPKDFSFMDIHGRRWPS